jgi:hypothetical protein
MKAILLVFICFCLHRARALVELMAQRWNSIDSGGLTNRAASQRQLAFSNPARE